MIPSLAAKGDRGVETSILYKIIFIKNQNIYQINFYIRILKIMGVVCYLRKVFKNVFKKKKGDFRFKNNNLLLSQTLSLFWLTLATTYHIASNFLTALRF